MLTERNGELLELTRSSFIDDLPIFAVDEAEQSALASRRFDRIVSIDKAGPETAMVKVLVGSRSVAGEARLLIDVLLLVRVGGGWRIVSRVFTPRDLS